MFICKYLWHIALCQAAYSIFNDEHNFVPIFNELLCSAEVPKLRGNYSVMCDKGVSIRCNGAEGGGTLTHIWEIGECSGEEVPSEERTSSRDDLM